MLIDLIVGSAVLLFGLYCIAWLHSPALRRRLEAPKHAFLARVAEHEQATPEETPQP